MANMLKLKGKIVENGMNVETVANQIGIDPATMYRKIKDNGNGFTIEEANKIAILLSLDLETITSIFFDDTVAENPH